jgi:hypothetical protein
MSERRPVDLDVTALLARQVLGLVEAFVEQCEPDIDKRVEFQRTLFKSLAGYCQFTADELAKATASAKRRKVEHDRGH